MIFERFTDRMLAQSSYAVGCERARRVAIVDPRRDVDVYLHFAAARRLAISHVVETHVHADYASGARELAARTGAALLLSAYDEGEAFTARFPHQDLREGEALEVGSVRLQPLHTPGHTPEHLCFVVFDEARSRDVPVALLSGDLLFVGSLGRPDLLGEASTLRLARLLRRSVRERLAALPDGVEVHPGHGAGSLCGAGMSARPSSTLGYERAANPYLAAELDEEAFVSRLLASAPPQPGYFLRMKRLNSEGPPALDGLPGLSPLAVERFAELAADGERWVVDVRGAGAFAAGHLPGSLALGTEDSLSTWAGWLLPYDRDLLLVAADAAQAEEAVRALVRVGHDRVLGWLDPERWRAAGRPQARLEVVAADELGERLTSGRATVLDVRTATEWRQAHLPGALHLPGGEVPARLADLPRGPLVVMCAAGYRSAAVASLLLRAGRGEVGHLAGGLGAWRRAGLPVAEE